MINRSRDIVRMGVTWYAPGTEKSGYLQEGRRDAVIDEDRRAEQLNQLALAVWSFARSLARHLTPPEEDEEQFQADVRERLKPEQAEALIAAVHRPNRAMFDIGCAINDLPMHFMRRNQLDADVSLFEDISGGCERIFSSPIPLVYSRHSARFLAAYLIFLPFGLWEPYKSSWNHIAMIPSVAVISIFLLGISELAISLEEPFSILPLTGYAEKIGIWTQEISKWRPPNTSSSKPAPVVKKISSESTTESSNSSSNSTDKEHASFPRKLKHQLQKLRK